MSVEMSILFDEDRLIQELRELPVKHRVAFAASCCERLFPNYEAFAVMENWGNPKVLRQTLDKVWQFLKGDTLSKEHIHELIRACEAVIPDTEDFITIFTGVAGDAAAAIIYTLESCLDGNPQRLAFVGRLAIGTLDTYLHIVNDPALEWNLLAPGEWRQLTPSMRIELVKHYQEEFNKWLQQAPLMRAELAKQQQDLEALKAHTALDPDFLGRMRQSSSKMGIQPFARGLVKIK